ncbi:MAG: outer membrane beta-barrel protein [Chitinophagaceae bacterium]|nr:outer membrane beta-barrel protein [Chitinophagaceae bacterium]
MKKIIIVTLCLFSLGQTYSQGFVKRVVERFSLEAFGGLANYQGELQESGYTFSQAKPAFALGGNIAITDKFYLRGLATLGTIQASDKYSSSLVKRQRNLDFGSKIYDASVTIVYDIFDVLEKRYTPYVFAGVSLYHFSPYTYDSTGTKIFLMPLGTEGQEFSQYPDRKRYKLDQISIPFGAGIKFAVNERVTIGWEFRFNKTFTDYLDDVSTTYASYSALISGPYGTRPAELAYRGDEVKNGNPNYPAAGTVRGNPKTKDWYYFSGITLTYRLFKSNRSLGRLGSNSEIKCPKNVY